MELGGGGKEKKPEQLFGPAIPAASLHPNAGLQSRQGGPRSERQAGLCHGSKAVMLTKGGAGPAQSPAKRSSRHPLLRQRLCLGAAARANWEALINGQRLLLTQVVFARIKAAAFMEVSLIELEGMRSIPPQPQDIRPKGRGRGSDLLLPPPPSCPHFLSGRLNFQTRLFLPSSRASLCSHCFLLPRRGLPGPADAFHL